METLNLLTADGLRSVNSRLPVDENTYFKMGSVTKMICAMAVLQLVDEGKLDLDADISQYFGYRIVNPYYPKTPLTLRQLLSHTSTVSERGAGTRGSYRGTRSGHPAHAVRHPLVAKPTDPRPESRRRRPWIGRFGN